MPLRNDQNVHAEQVLMATVADKFPTPCTASFWTPDSEGQQQQQRAEVMCKPFEADSAAEVTRPAVFGAPESDSRGFGDGADVDSAGASVPYPETTTERGIPLDPAPRCCFFVS